MLRKGASILTISYFNRLRQHWGFDLAMTLFAMIVFSFSQTASRKARRLLSVV